MPKTVSVQTVEPIEMRERILEAALEVFAERGFEGATLNLIASRSESTTPLIVYHFKNKVGLWREVVLRYTARHMGVIAGVLDKPGLNSGERLREFIATGAQLLADNPGLHRLLVGDSYQSSERLTWLVETHVKPYYARMVRLIEEAQREGHVRQLDPSRLRYAILGVISLPAIGAEYGALTGENPRSSAQVKRSIQFIYDLIFNN